MTCGSERLVLRCISGDRGNPGPLGIDGCTEFGEPIPVQRVPDPFASSIPLNETSIRQDFQVVRDRRLTLA